MVTTRDGMRGLVVLTIQDTRGTVVFHETVRPEEVDSIVARIFRSIR
jgi:hypothetical protein